MASVIITTQPTSLSAIPGQDSTFSVVASADFASAAYAYQWSVNGTPVSGKTARTYTIDPVIGDNNKSFSVAVSALSGNVLMATVESNSATLTITPENIPFSNFAVYPETGEQRFRRLRHLGYV